MPYIKKDMRDELEPIIHELANQLSLYDDEEIEGVMNYTITELINRGMKRPRWRYKWINRVVGVLGCVLLEFYRRLAANYENDAIESNGDIECYMTEQK